MTPAFEEAMAKIAEERRLCVFRLEGPGHGHRKLHDRIADLYQVPLLDRQAEVYQFIHDMNSITHEPEWRRLMDEVYIYTRKQASRYEKGLIIQNGGNLPSDEFDVKRFRWFSVPCWWRHFTDDKSDDLISSDFFDWGTVRGSDERVFIEPGNGIRRWEVAQNGWREQWFSPFHPDDRKINTRLMFVLQQWVEQADENLASALNTNEFWCSLVSLPRAEWPSWDAGHTLRSLQLPNTPSVHKYLCQQNERHFGITSELKGQEIVPRRGGMVTTFVLSTYGVHGQRRSKNLLQFVQQTTCSASWVTDDFREQAKVCRNEHRKWAEQWVQGILPSGEIPAGRPAGKNAVQIDYDMGVPVKTAVANAKQRENAPYLKDGGEAPSGELKRIEKNVKEYYRYHDEKKQKNLLSG